MKNSNNVAYVVGAGLSGAVIARKLAEEKDVKVIVFERNSYIGGMCATKVDHQTGIMVHLGGPHIFHTSDPRVMKYVQRFAEWVPYVNRVVTKTDLGLFQMPINLFTINQVFNTKMGSREARKFLEKLGASDCKKLGIAQASIYNNAYNYLVSQIGVKLTENFFENYTKKQWGKSLKETDCSIVKRVPIRFDYNNDYYTDTWQALPKDGYSVFIRNILNHKNIEVITGVDNFFEFIKDTVYGDKPRAIFYTGSLDDKIFRNFDYYKKCITDAGFKLKYRGVELTWTITEDSQGTAVINYGDSKYDFTRVVEYNHLNPEPKPNAKYFINSCETPVDAGDNDSLKHYPVITDETLEAYQKHCYYLPAVSHATPCNNAPIIPCGRLGSYKYINMDKAIEMAWETVKKAYGDNYMY